MWLPRQDPNLEPASGIRGRNGPDFNVHLSDQLSELCIITTLLITRDTMSSQALPVALQSKMLGYGRAGSAHLSAINLDL